MEEQDLTTREDEVEAHGLADRPASESPTNERVAEEPDVEGHALTDRPASERPASE